METEISQTSQSDEIIEKAKKSEELGSTPFMNPEAKEGPKKRGRKPGSTNKAKDSSFTSDKKESPGKTESEAQTPKFDIPTKTLCYLPARAVSAWGVSYVGDPKAAMTPDDLEAFATGLGMVIDKHLPDAMKNYGPEMMFAMALTQYGVRIMAMKKLKTQQLKNMQNQATTQSTIKQEQKEPTSVHLVDLQEGAEIPL